MGYTVPGWFVVALVSVGGGIGALSRWGLAVALPHSPGRFPWSTLITNLVGCAAIGMLTVVVARAGPRWWAVRPMLSVGVLGGFTTFSTYVVEAGQLVSEGSFVSAAIYAAGTVIGALIATWVAAATMERVLGRLRERSG